MSAEISERAFERAIECALLQNGPDACPGDSTAVQETPPPYGEDPVPGGCGGTPARDDPTFWGGSIPWVLPKDMKALRLLGSIEPLYFARALEGLARGIVATVVEEAAHGTRVIRMDEWRDVVVPIPPPEEQHAITGFLEAKTAKIDALVAKVQEAIDRLKEYRTALISAAITGKIDVRGEAP